MLSLMQSTEEGEREGRACLSRRDPIWGKNKWGNAGPEGEVGVNMSEAHYIYA